jgi:hypothetical protein
MTHLTSKERTCFTAKEIKIRNVLNKLKLEIVLDESLRKPEDNRPYKINRKTLIEAIQNALNLASDKTVREIISFLLGKGFILNNYATQFSAKKGIIKPTQDTLYELNYTLINSYLGNSPPLTLNRNLMSFSKP